MKTQAAAFLSVFALAAVPPLARGEQRQLGAHVHGHGRLNIAIEGKKVSMELEAPGADIVGFEHEPETAEQKAAVAEAQAKLANASALFTLEPKARCELDRVKVARESAEHGHEAAAEKAAGGAAGKEKEAGEQHHSEFRAEYFFLCSAASRLTSITFQYFAAFPGAQELNVTVAATKGQSSFEVTRETPSLDLTGIM
jgi:Protein of unknown function (DUF2796)